jgi:protease-4
MTLEDWLRRFADARRDKSIRAIALEIDSTRMNWAQAQELADAIERLNAVKPVYTYLVSGGAMEYIVASAGREVSMEPSGTLAITGLGVELIFFRGTLDWVGVEPQIIQIGRFKSGAEHLTRTEPSEEMLEVYNGLLDDLYDQLCGQIALQRKLDAAAVKKAIDAGPLSPEDAHRFRLVDRLLQRADWEKHVKKATARAGRPVTWKKNYGRKTPKTINLSNPFALLGMLFGTDDKQRIKDPTIAIIHADGVLVPGKSGEGLLGQRLAGARTLANCFDEVAEDDRIKAVILRINSPGGSALASELIYQAVERCARKKPVITSVSGVAASGGYYVAVGAPTIIADPCAVTGSIGVISGKFAISGLLEKLRITTYGLTRGKNAGLGLSRPWTEREKAVIRKHAQRTYNVFARRVAESRGERIKDIEGVAEGRIFTGREAVESGLVDKVGGLRDAVIAAQSAANLTESHFITLPRPRTLLKCRAGQQ